MTQRTTTGGMVKTYCIVENSKQKIGNWGKIIFEKKLDINERMLRR